MSKIKPCKDCVNYNHSSCPFGYLSKEERKERRTHLIEDYDADCFMTETDQALCRLYGCIYEVYEDEE